jgi:hypothetical protein
MSAPEEIAEIEAGIECYEEAIGAKLNIAKPHAMAVGSWDTTSTVMIISCNTEVKVLGIQMVNVTVQSAVSRWSWITNIVLI